MISVSLLLFWVFCLQKFLCSSTTQSVSVIRKMRISGQCQWHILVYLYVYHIWDVNVVHMAENWLHVRKKCSCLLQPVSSVLFNFLEKVARTKEEVCIEWDNFFVSLAKNLLAFKKLLFFLLSFYFFLICLLSSLIYAWSANK